MLLAPLSRVEPLVKSHLIGIGTVCCPSQETPVGRHETNPKKIKFDKLSKPATLIITLFCKRDNENNNIGDKRNDI